MERDSQIPAMLAFCTVILIAAALYFTRPLFAPLAFAVFILAIVWPFTKALQKRLPKVIALFLTLSVTIVVVVAFASVIAWALSAIADWLLNNVQRFQSHYVQLTQWLEAHDIFVAGILAERFNVMWLLRLFQEIAGRLNRLAGFAILIFIFLMIGLLEIDGFRQRIAALDKERGVKLVQAGSEIASKFRRYILVRTLLSVLTGLAIWGFALLAGLEPAAAWGLLAFALNYIPFMGPFVATMLPALFAIAQLDSMAGDHARLHGSDGHPVPYWKLSGASRRWRRSDYFPFRGRFCGFLLDLFVGHSWSIHRRAYHDHHHHAMRTISIHPLGRDPLGQAVE